MQDAQFGQRSRLNLAGVHPKLVLVLETAIENSPVDFTVVEGARTAERQAQLYAQGRTTKGVIVTQKDGYNKKSAHQYKQTKEGLFGCAVDVYPWKDGSVRLTEIYVPAMQKQIADHIKATAKSLGINIICGIDWRKPYDPPHFEYVE